MAMVFMELQETLLTKFCVCSLIVFLTSCQKNNVEHFIENEIKTELRNGVLFFNNRAFKGVLLSYYENGTKKTETRYKQGKKHGKEKNWYKDGKIKMTRQYNNGIKVNVHKGWWENRNLKYRYIFDDKGRYNGKVEEWYVTGQKLREFNYTNGLENGKQKLWDLNGNIKANYEVINGERYGLIGLKNCFTVFENK